jgi:hypothetical protein
LTAEEKFRRGFLGWVGALEGSAGCLRRPLARDLSVIMSPEPVSALPIILRQREFLTFHPNITTSWCNPEQ